MIYDVGWKKLKNSIFDFDDQCHRKGRFWYNIINVFFILGEYLIKCM